MFKRNRQFMVGLTIVLAAGSIVYAGSSDDESRGKHRFTFALWGDTPYDTPPAVTEKDKITALIADINDSKVAFSVFDGDIKSGSTRCDDAVYTEAIDRFNTFEAPMIYVPGDNEWTDCHRKNNGSFNALERLAHIRTTMFATPESFGREKLLLEHQDVSPVPNKSYPENTRWSYGDVVFVGLNIPGSNNNKVNPGQCTSAKSARIDADCVEDNAEYAARDAANIAFMHESFALATRTDALGVMVIIQADPSFDLPETETDNERTCVRAATGECLDPPNNTNRNLANYDGYDAFLAALTAETKAFAGQVVLVHGDTHFYKVDKPLNNATNLLPNFTRVCTFGSPAINWIRVTVDSKSRTLFKFEPMIVADAGKHEDHDKDGREQ